MEAKRGFTLVEMMITVSIAGILAAVAIPAYREYVRYSDTNKCASYILASRLNATNLITVANGNIAGIDAAALGLTNGNGQCSGGITVTVAAGVLSVVGATGTPSASAAASRRFTMTRAAANGGWACQTTDSGGTVLSAGSCTELN